MTRPTWPWGRAVRRAGMTTYLPSRGLAASGGTDLLLAGARRIVECGAQVGVHSWASGPVNGNDLPRDDPRHRFYLDYYRDINVPDAFYWFTLQAAAPDSVHWMTEDEMALYGVRTHSGDPCGLLSYPRSSVAQVAFHVYGQGKAPCRTPKAGTPALLPESTGGETAERILVDAKRIHVL